ncbi:MAG TPA: hypothetical protein PK536_09220 [Ignavibacteria bacterium]|nr:hypothetical protein [Ignavibacteria bacterium]HRK00044.1 hypothetical protein [Ignavibacteria bacterium]
MKSLFVSCRKSGSHLTRFYLYSNSGVLPQDSTPNLKEMEVKY